MLIVAAVVAVAIGLGLGFLIPITRPDSVVSRPAIGGPFALVNQDGQPVTEKTFAGRHMLVYFGYTYCPDVCPTTLGTVAEALRRLGPEGDHVVPVMITVDPERDTPAVLSEYMAAFGPRFVGLSGDSEETARAARQFGAVYMRVGSGPDYAMDHSAKLYVVDSAGHSRASLAHGVPPDAVAAAVRRVKPES